MSQPGKLDLDIPLASLLLYVYDTPPKEDSYDQDLQVAQLALLAELYEYS